MPSHRPSPQGSRDNRNLKKLVTSHPQSTLKKREKQIKAPCLHSHLYSRRTQGPNLGNDALLSGLDLPISIDLTSAKLKTIHPRCVHRPTSSKQPMLRGTFFR